MKNLTNEQLLESLPICSIGQLSKQQCNFLNRLARQGKITKTKWYWNSMCIGSKKTWYYPYKFFGGENEKS